MLPVIIGGFSGFGLFLLIANIISRFGNNHEYRKNNKECIKRTYNPKRETYIDWLGRERKLNGELCFTSRDCFGDLIQTNQYGQVVRNFNEEERIKAPGTVTQLTGYSCKDASVRRRDAEGFRFQDRTTGDIYCARNVEVEKYHYLCFYMDVKTGNLVRLTDWEVENNKRNKREGKEYLTDDMVAEIIKRENSKYRDPNNPYKFYRNGEVSVL